MRVSIRPTRTCRSSAKLLKVPLHFQADGSVDCGPTCVQMMLDYYGIKRTLPDLAAHLNYSKMGTSSFDNGTLFLSEGFSVTAVTANPLLFPADEIRSLSDHASLLLRLNQIEQKRPQWADNFATLRRYIEKGGVMKLEIPAFRHIKTSIDAGNPLLALTYGQALGRNQGGFHFMVVNGYKRGQVYLTNPLRQARQGWFPLDRFLYAVHASSVGDPDNGSLIIPSRTSTT